MHYDTPDIRRFDPVPAQYVRVYPERWSPAGIGMRLEVLGCDWTGKACSPLPISLTWSRDAQGGGQTMRWMCGGAAFPADSWKPGPPQALLCSSASDHGHCSLWAQDSSSRDVLCLFLKTHSGSPAQVSQKQIITAHHPPKFN